MSAEAHDPCRECGSKLRARSAADPALCTRCGGGLAGDPTTAAKPLFVSLKGIYDSRDMPADGYGQKHGRAR